MPNMVNSSLNLSSSIRLLLLLLLLGCCRPSSSAALPTHASDRWRDPCAAESSFFQKFTMKADEAKDAFEELSHRSIALKHIVNSLKNDYANARYGNASHAEEERVNSGLVITGSPSWNTSNDNTNQTLLLCYENLARLAVLTRLTREGEQSAEANERYHFASRFQEIEDHHNAGLYIILCYQNVTMESLGIVSMSPETEAEVASISFDAAPNNAYRHRRDYLVLHVLENSADELRSRFDRLVGQVTSQTTSSSTQ